MTLQPKISRPIIWLFGKKACFIGLLLSIVLVSACASSHKVPVSVVPADEAKHISDQKRHEGILNKDLVEKGDLVTVHVTASHDDGSIFFTTLPEVAQNPDLKKAPWFVEFTQGKSLELVAGSDAILPGLGEAVIGALAGQTHTVVLDPQHAFGLPDPTKITQLAIKKQMGLEVWMTPQEFVEAFGKFPVAGEQVNLLPYFPSVVEEVRPQNTRLRFLAQDNMIIEEPFGTATVSVKPDGIVITLEPQIGAYMEVSGNQGRIVSLDKDYFTLDFNNPMAGRQVIYELSVESIIKAKELDEHQISWVEDYGKALSLSLESQKPMVLVLYASWCSFSKRLMEETLIDPRVRLMADGFVWAKVDSSIEKGIGELFEQNGFPLTVVVSPQQGVVSRIEGFVSAQDFVHGLEAGLAEAAASASWGD